MKNILIDYTEGIVRVALVDGKTLEEFSVEHSSRTGIVGNIYKGKVENVLSGMKAVFVNIGLDRNGFLHVGDDLVDPGQICVNGGARPLNVSPGDMIMCQVEKDSFGTKGPRLTTDITLAGYYLVFTPMSSYIGVSRKIENPERRQYLEDLVKSLCPQNMGFIVRSASYKASDDEIKAEIDQLISLWDRVVKNYQSATPTALVFQEAELLERAVRDTLAEDIDKVIVNEKTIAEILRDNVSGATVEYYDGDRNIFKHFGVDNQINRLYERRVNLKNGGYLIIDKTEALTVIDVNTGKFVGGQNLEDTVYKTNLEGAEEIARQLRLRNIGGIVVIDFIDMTDKSHKTDVVNCLKECLKKDSKRTSAVEMTSLGLVQLTRKKTSLPIAEFMLDDCEDCIDGHVLSSIQALLMMRGDLVDFTLKNKGESIVARVNPALIEAHKEVDVFSVDKGKALSGVKAYLIPDEKLKRNEYFFEITDGEEILPNVAVEI
ncbi:MAG: Rne/Rng family ribonuclease [Clostridia bacterium]|nr:Rne/Rng family ribonuclease [Clostridia bacterium]